MTKSPEQLKLSILVLSIPSRLLAAKALTDKLLQQIGSRPDVELLMLLDNCSLDIYEKRNELLGMARGSHLAWIDDDDDVADTYVERITEAIARDPDADVISFNQLAYLDGKLARVFARMGNPHDDVRLDPDDPTRFLDTLRPPYHWCVWRTELAKSEVFRRSYAESGQSTEDIDWLERLYPKVRKSVYLPDEWLHVYRWSAETTRSVA